MIWCKVVFCFTQVSVLESLRCLIRLQVAECYYVLEPDIAKDASTEATILCKALDDAKEILRQRSTTMPGNMILEVGWVPRCCT